MAASTDLKQQVEDVLKRQASLAGIDADSAAAAQAPRMNSAEGVPVQSFNGNLPPGAESNPLLLDQAGGSELTKQQLQLQQPLRQEQELQEEEKRQELQRQQEEQQRLVQQRQAAQQQQQQQDQAAEALRRVQQQVQQQAQAQAEPQLQAQVQPQLQPSQQQAEPSLKEVQWQLQVQLQQLRDLEATRDKLQHLQHPAPPQPSAAPQPALAQQPAAVQRLAAAPLSVGALLAAAREAAAQAAGPQAAGQGAAAQLSGATSPRVTGSFLAQQQLQQADFEDHPRPHAAPTVPQKTSAATASTLQALTQQLKDEMLQQAQRRQQFQNDQLTQAQLALEADRHEQLVQEQLAREAQHRAQQRQDQDVQARLQKLREEQRNLYALEQSLATDMGQGLLPMPASRQPAAQTFLYRSPPEQQHNVEQVPMQVASGGLSSFSSVQAQDFAPDHSQCHPKCTYTCTNPTCEEVCEAQCESPKCETRCGGSDLSACFMQCGQPHCAVVCPKNPCAGAACPSCRTQCSDPMCMLQCPKAQPCHNVCEQPKCSWKCRAPDSCPKPVCNMTCDAPSTCRGSTFQQLPALTRGEMLVQSFLAPASGSRIAEADAGMPRQEASTIQVPVYVGADGSTFAGQEPSMRQQMMVQMPIVNLPKA